MQHTTHHPLHGDDTRFVHALEDLVRNAIDAAPKSQHGFDRPDDGRMAFSLEAWRMPGNDGTTPCLVTASFGAIHSSACRKHVQKALQDACASRPMHIQMRLSARLWFGTESAHHAMLRRRAQMANNGMVW